MTAHGRSGKETDCHCCRLPLPRSHRRCRKCHRQHLCVATIRTAITSAAVARTQCHRCPGQPPLSSMPATAAARVSGRRSPVYCRHIVRSLSSPSAPAADAPVPRLHHHAKARLLPLRPLGAIAAAPLGASAVAPRCTATAPKCACCLALGAPPSTQHACHRDLGTPTLLPSPLAVAPKAYSPMPLSPRCHAPFAHPCAPSLRTCAARPCSLHLWPAHLHGPRTRMAHSHALRAGSASRSRASARLTRLPCAPYLLPRYTVTAAPPRPTSWSLPSSRICHRGAEEFIVTATSPIRHAPR